MRILFLTHSFNSLSQRLFVELTELGHQVSIEFDINDRVTTEAVELFRPDVIVAPYLRRAIPERIWRQHLCLVVHPGIIGDRGPSALDWAIMTGARRWGVTCLQADAIMDGGDIWSSVEFDMRPATKSSMYRNEVAEAAVQAVKEALSRFESGTFSPRALDYSAPDVKGCWRPLMKQSDRAIDWSTDDTATIVRKIRAADGSPGVLDELLGARFYLYDACEEETLRGIPGTLVAKRHGAVCRATVDGAVWIGHARQRPGADGHGLKLPATLALAEQVGGLPEISLNITAPAECKTFREICYEERNGVGYLSFAFYNGAMSLEQCQRLSKAYRYARSRPTRVIVLLGGPDFWSNGLNLNTIEAAASAADESWRNINAIDDVARAIITTDDKITIAALQGNAGAGGVFLALAADKVIARRAVILNPHYKNMGNLYGSEYWTYLLPRRVGPDRARELTENRLPVGSATARKLGLVDEVFDGDVASFARRIEALAEDVADDTAYRSFLADKRKRRLKDEMEVPLESYRAAELENMKLNFYGFDPSYHVARYNFVFKVPHSRTPLHLAKHRRLQCRDRGRASPSRRMGGDSSKGSNGPGERDAWPPRAAPHESGTLDGSRRSH